MTHSKTIKRPDGNYYSSFIRIQKELWTKYKQPFHAAKMELWEKMKPEL